MDVPNQWQPKRRQEGRVIFGFIIAGLGILLLLQMFNLLPPLIYSLHFGWPILLIVIGLAIGIGNGFRKNAWWILVAIGVAHLIPSFYIGDVPSRRLLWPAVLIIAGLLMVLRKRNPQRVRARWEHSNPATLTNDTDVINIDVTFSGRKEIVTSRNFKGGSVRATFSGVELNMAGAEGISGTPMVMDVQVAFAGLEMVIPSNWELQNEIRPTMGSVEDHRTIRTGGDPMAGRPLLILRGTVAFGSVEVKSY